MTSAEIPVGSVVITPAQMYEVMQSTRDEVKHLSSIIDPALSEVRADIADTKIVIAEMVAERKAETKELRDRVNALEGRPVVTPRSMWTGVGVTASVVAVAVSVLALVLR